jgi:FAD binding domain
MLARTETNLTITERWLAQLERALSDRDGALLKMLFHADSHWRDVLALTWRITTVNGRGAIVRELRTDSQRARPVGFKIPPHRAAPRQTTRAGTESIEAIFTFETADGRGSGVVRLRAEDDNDNTPKAWTLLTALDEIKGHEEQLGRSRPQAKACSRDFRGPNWFDIRRAAAEYADRDPAVLVVGGGQAGLSVAACLTQLGIDTLIVDREPRIGDNWRKRYHTLVLHNQVHVNHLPYMRFPPNWPAYIPKDKIAGWFGRQIVWK